MKQKNAVICADIVSSSSLSVNQLKEVQSLMAKWIDEKVVWLAERDVDSWGRVVRGDMLEFYMSKPSYGLRLALELRLMMLQYCQTQKQVPMTSRAMLHFLEHGMRVVVGVGEMRIHDRESNLMDGDAIYLAGRLLDKQHTSGKEKVSIKETLLFDMTNDVCRVPMQLMVRSVDWLTRKATAKQCEVILYKLQGKKESEIASALGISIPTVNEHSTKCGWSVIEDIVNYFENYQFV